MPIHNPSGDGPAGIQEKSKGPQPRLSAPQHQFLVGQCAETIDAEMLHSFLVMSKRCNKGSRLPLCHVRASDLLSSSMIFYDLLCIQLLMFSPRKRFNICWANVSWKAAYRRTEKSRLFSKSRFQLSPRAISVLCPRQHGKRSIQTSRRCRGKENGGLLLQ